MNVVKFGQCVCCVMVVMVFVVVVLFVCVLVGVVDMNVVNYFGLIVLSVMVGLVVLLFGIGVVLQMFVGFVVVIGFVFVCVWFVCCFGFQFVWCGGLFKVVLSVGFGVKESVMIVEIGDIWFVFGVVLGNV